MANITPEYPIIPLKEKVIVENEGLNAKVGGLGGRSEDTLAKAINNKGNLVKDVVNTSIDTSAQNILNSFSFGASGALQIGTYVNGVTGDIKISPAGIVARDSAGSNTITINGTTGNITLVGTITASAGAIGGFSIGTDYIRDVANSFGMASTVTGGDDVRFWAGDTYANRATAPFRVTEAGAIVATDITITGGTVNWSTVSGTTNAPSDNATVGAKAGTNLTDSADASLGDADVITSQGTSSDTSNVNSKSSSIVQERAENDYLSAIIKGHQNDGFTEVANPTLVRSMIFTEIGSTGGASYLYSPKLAASSGANDLVSFDNDMEFNCSIKFKELKDNASWGIGDFASIASIADLTSRDVIAFQLDGTEKLYAANGISGGVDVRTEIIGITLTNETVFKIVWEAGVSAKFYVDDVLKVTHTTGLPSGVNTDPRVYFGAEKDLNNVSFFVKNNYLIKVTV